MKQAEGKRKGEIDSSRRAKSNGIAFLFASGLFLLYWILFVLFGLNERPSAFSLYLFFVILELIFNSLIIVVTIFSLRKKNHEKYELFFTVNWILITIATFPMPFAYLFSAGYSNAPMDNEIASMATPTTILCILALFFASAAFEKYQEQDITAHKVFIRLMVGCLLTATIYVFGCMLYKIWTNTNPLGLLTTVYFYVALALIYLALCIYSSVCVGHEMSLPSIDAKRKEPSASHSLFHTAIVFYLCYALIEIIIDCYNLASAFHNEAVTMSIPFGKVDSPLLLGDEIFLFLIHSFMLVYAFLLLHDRHEANRRDPLFSLNVLAALFSLSYAIPAIVGAYGIVISYLTSKVRIVHVIIAIFAIITFASVGVGTSIAGLLNAEKHRIDSALFLAVSSCMMVGVSLALIYGEIALLLGENASWPQTISTFLERFPDVALVTISLLALSREFPRKK